MTLSQQAPDGHTAWCEIKTPNHPECTGWCEECAEYVDWANPDFIPSKRLRTSPRAVMREMASHVAPAPTVGAAVLSGFPAGEQGSERASARWNEDQKKLVDAAILAVATRHAKGGEFTTDEIWDELAGAVPVTKGLTARLMRAVRAGVMDKTGKTAVSERGGHHDHGQRLGVWYSLL